MKPVTRTGCFVAHLNILHDSMMETSLLEREKVFLLKSMGISEQIF